MSLNLASAASLLSGFLSCRYPTGVCQPPSPAGGDAWIPRGPLCDCGRIHAGMLVTVYSLVTVAEAASDSFEALPRTG